MLRVKQVKAVIIFLALSSQLAFSSPVFAESSPEANLTNWSQQMANRLNVKMERKLQQIVMDAQILQNLEQDSRQLTTFAEKDIGCEPDNEISKI